MSDVPVTRRQLREAALTVRKPPRERGSSLPGDHQDSKKEGRRKLVRWTLVGIAALLIFCAGWLGIRGLIAKSELDAAQALISTVTEQASDLDIDGATASFEKLKGHTATAHSLTDDIIWRAAEAIPLAGANLTVVRQLAAVADDVMLDVAGPLLSVASVVDPESLTPKDGAIDLDPIISAVPAVLQSKTGMEKAIADAEGIDSTETIGAIRTAHAKVSKMLTELAPKIDLLADVVPLLPTMLGADGPRSYAIMFQNSAEPRALGGTALSFALISVDDGRIALTDTFSASTGAFTTGPSKASLLPDGAGQIYGDFYANSMPNVTARPSFSLGAEIASEIWARDQGTPIDAIISIDPVALSYLIKATGPVTLSTGDVLSHENVVQTLLNGVYLRFNSADWVADNLKQDAIFNETVEATFSKITGGSLDPKMLVTGIVDGWTQERILMWSAREDEQAQLAAIGLNGELPVSDGEADRVGIYFEDNIGSKVAYYTRQAVKLSSAACDGTVTHHVEVKVTNGMTPDVAAAIPISVYGMSKVEKVPIGTWRYKQTLYAPPGSTITQVAVNGAPQVPAAYHDGDYPVSLLTLLVGPGESHTVAYDVTMPAGAPLTALEAKVTPMIHPTEITTGTLACAAAG